MCSVLQCWSVFCSVVQCSAVNSSVLQCGAELCSLVHYSAVYSRVLQCSAVLCSAFWWLYPIFTHSLLCPPLLYCAACSVKCAVCSVQCAVCSVQCAVCSLQCAECVECTGDLHCSHQMAAVHQRSLPPAHPRNRTAPAHSQNRTGLTAHTHPKNRDWCSCPLP